MQGWCKNQPFLLGSYMFNIQNIVVVALILFMGACGKQEDTTPNQDKKEKVELVGEQIHKQANQQEAEQGTEQENKRKDEDKNFIENSSDILSVKEKFIKEKNEKSSKTQRKTVLINEQKIEVFQFPIVKGTKVYNPLLLEYGVIKGDIVIVSSHLNNIKSHLSIDEVNEIAKNTYRIKPKSTNLYDVYKKALTIPEVKHVELSIDYSLPIKNHENM